MSKGKVLEFSISDEQYEKLVNAKLDQIKEIMAPEEFGAEFARIEKDPEAVDDARLQRIILDLYAAQDALFAAGPRNIRVLVDAELISKEKGAVLFVMAKMLEVKMREALEEKLEEMNEAAEKEAAKPDLRVVH